MAKVTEGDPYYYAPSSMGEPGYCVFKRAIHPNVECIAVELMQDNASLIVDALNFREQMKRAVWKSVDKDNMEYVVHTTCYVRDMLYAKA